MYLLLPAMTRCAGEEDQVTWLDFRPLQIAHIFFIYITVDINQNVLHVKVSVNLAKKYWADLQYQKLTNSPACFIPSIHMQSWSMPSRKFCSKIKLSFVFRGHAVASFDNFSWKLPSLSWGMFWKFWSKDVYSPFPHGGDIIKIVTNC